MASSISARKQWHPLLAAIALILAATAAVPASAGRRPVRLRFYMHDITGGPGQTAVMVVKGTGPEHPAMPPGSHFGDTMAIDDLLTEGADVGSDAVGRAQGSYILASMSEPVLVVSMTVLLTAGPYNGSTIVVAGRDNVFEEVRELAVVGGTGQLRRATGVVLWRTTRLESPVHMVLELDVHATVPSSSSSAARRSALPLGPRVTAGDVSHS